MLVRPALTVLGVVLLGAFGGTGARAESGRVSRAPKIHVAEELRPVVSEMLAASATFRHQWEVIVQRHRTHVAIFFGKLPLDSTRRAKTVITKYSSGLLLAVIHVAPGDDLAEIVAHEFEHVIEQIEGVNLDALVRSGSKAAKRREDGAYETVRAQHAGLVVLAEVRMARPE